MSQALKIQVQRRPDDDDQTRSSDEADYGQLPAELLFAVFRHLDPHELATAAQVCARWRLLVADYVLWAAEADALVLSQPIPSSLLHRYAVRAQPVRRLHLTRDMQLTAVALTQLLSIPDHSLTRQSTQSQSTQSQSFQSQSTQSQSFQSQSTQSQSSSSSNDSSLSMMMMQLDQLSVDYCESLGSGVLLLSQANYFAHLSELSLSESSVVDDGFLWAVLEQTRDTLTSLQLSKCPEVYFSNLMGLRSGRLLPPEQHAHVFPGLQRLDLSDTSVGSQGFALLARSFPSLQRLNLSGTRVSLLRASDHLAPLERLQWFDASHTPLELATFGDAEHPSLRELRLCGLALLQSLHVRDLVALRSVDVSGCAQLQRLSVYNAPALAALRTAGCAALKPDEALLAVASHCRHVDVSGCAALALRFVQWQAAMPAPGALLRTLVMHNVGVHLAARDLLSSSDGACFLPQLRCLEVSGRTQLDDVFALLARSCALRRLHIDDSPLLETPCLQPLLTAARGTLRALTVQHCPNLATVRLDDFAQLCRVDVASCAHLNELRAVHCPRLQQLDVAFCSELSTLVVGGAPLLSQFSVRGCPALRTFDVSSPLLGRLAVADVLQLTDVRVDLPALRSLSLRGLQHAAAAVQRLLSPGVVELQLCALPGLSTIDLSAAAALTRLHLENLPGLVAVAGAARRLTDVTVLFCKNARRFLPALLGASPRLARVKITGVPAVSSLTVESDAIESLSLDNLLSLASLTLLAPRLHTLTVEKCSMVTSLHLRSDRLRTVALRGCHRLATVRLALAVLDADVLLQLAACERLANIDLTECRHLDPAVVQAVPLYFQQLKQLTLPPSC